MRKWAPALKASLAVLRIAAAVTRVVTGLPISIPEGRIDESRAVAILFGEAKYPKVLAHGVAEFAARMPHNISLYPLC